METTSLVKALHWNQAKLPSIMPQMVGVVAYGVKQVAVSIKMATAHVKQAAVAPPLIVQALVASMLPLAELTLGDIDYYDVSLVDGFNLPLVVKPGGGKGNCSTAGCDGDLRQNCSLDLGFKKNGKVVGCRSACDDINTEEYCCCGAYEDPVACLPTNYSKSFKHVCPAASSYAYDDRVSIITCSASDYMVAFCATRNNTICTYHEEKLVCSITLEGFKAFSQIWRSLMQALPLISILQILF